MTGSLLSHHRLRRRPAVRTGPRLANGLTTAVIALALNACAIGFDAEEIEAVRDFIYVNQLEEVDQLRFFRQLSYTYVNDQYVTVPTRNGAYLIEFARVCRELRQLEFTPDMIDRRDDNTLRAGFDTIRGCRIGKIYEISEFQLDELRDLGDAPGDEIFLPGKDEEEEDS